MRSRGGAFSDILSALRRSQTIVKVQNKSGVALDQFNVVELRDPIISPTDNLTDFKLSPCFEARKPKAPGRKESLAILLEPLATNAIGNAVASGVVITKIDVSSGQGALDYADAETNVYATLKLKTSGPISVLWREPGTGEKWAIVSLTGGKGDGFFPAYVSGVALRNGRYHYSATEYKYNADGTLTTLSGGRVSISGAGATVEVVSDGNGTTVHEVQTVTLVGATGGTFTLTANGFTTAPIAWNASAGTIQAALTAAGATGITVAGTTYTWTDFADHAAITVDCTLLEPLPNKPLFDLNNALVSVPTMEFVRPGYVATGIRIRKIRSGDGTLSAQFEIYLDARNGSFTLTVDSGTATSAIAFDASAGAIDTALTTAGTTQDVTGSGIETDPFVVDFDDTADHDLNFDDTNLVSNSNYSFRASGAGVESTCLTALASPTTLPGYSSGATLNFVVYDSGTGCYKMVPSKLCTEP